MAYYKMKGLDFSKTDGFVRPITEHSGVTCLWCGEYDGVATRRVNDTNWIQCWKPDCIAKTEAPKD